MTMKKKLKSKSGFTLAETLLAVLIMLLVSVIMANGIPVARNVYNNVIIGANAQMLLSTAITSLRNELGTAKDIVFPAGTTTTVRYYKAGIGAYSQLSVDPNEGIQLMDYVEPEDGTPLPEAGSETSRVPHNLLSNAAANENKLIVTYASAEMSTTIPDVIVIKNIEVKLKQGTKSTLTSLDELNIRLIPVSA